MISPPDHERLVILLHGVGGTGSMLMPLAESWRHGFENTRFAAPNGPYRHAYGYGYQWFSIEAAQLQPDRLRAVRDDFDTVIRGVLRQHGFSDRLEHVAFVGVSQGAIVAIDAVASGRWPVGALVSFAGLLSPEPVWAPIRPTPTLLIHGAQDRTIPVQASAAAAGALEAAGHPVTLKILPDVGHTVTMEGAKAALDFLKTAAF